MIRKSAVAAETHEYTDMSSGTAKYAHNEGFDEIAEWMEAPIKAERSQASRLPKALDSLGD